MRRGRLYCLDTRPKLEPPQQPESGGWNFGMIEAVEELSPELCSKSLVRTEFCIFEEGKIKVLHAIGPNVGLGTRIGAVAEVGALSEYRSVKPLSQPLIERTRGQMRQS